MSILASCETLSTTRIGRVRLAASPVPLPPGLLPLNLVLVLLLLPAMAQAQNSQTVVKAQDAALQDRKVQNALALLQKVAEAEPTTLRVTDRGITRNPSEAEMNVYNHGLTTPKQDQIGIATFTTGHERSSREHVTLRLWYYPSANGSVWNNDKTGKTRNNEEFSISGPVGDTFVIISAVRNSDHISYDEGLAGASGLGASRLRDDVKGGVGHVKNIFSRSGSNQSSDSAPPAVQGRQIYAAVVVNEFYKQFQYYMDLFKANGLDKDAPPVRGDAYKRVPRTPETPGQK